RTNLSKKDLLLLSLKNPALYAALLYQFSSYSSPTTYPPSSPLYWVLQATDTVVFSHVHTACFLLHVPFADACTEAFVTPLPQFAYLIRYDSVTPRTMSSNTFLQTADDATLILPSPFPVFPGPGYAHLIEAKQTVMPLLTTN